MTRRARIFLRTVVEMLREIFDESAYQRYLNSHGLANSRENYRQFLRRRAQSKENRPRCC